MNLLNFARICLSLYMLRRGSNGTARLPSLIMLDVGTLATHQLTTGIIVFLIDVIVVAIVRNGKKHCHAELSYSPGLDGPRSDYRALVNHGWHIWSMLSLFQG
ncbi:hypothetical protein C8J55DRAFT_513301 [Lentinula edodes]|uniref:Uncharacterized protein n=1 Tax=Lentinula lateritia TaxID=40482 RepID=A0A9W9DPU7_9AGAR|nr:hypothetical protein C8J55DRAFT_513301 [Lentinula edodes]